MNITVYLGAYMGKSDLYKERVSELGKWIGKAGHHLVYGGSKVGLMGVLAESVLAAGGTVTGVEPEFFIDSQVQYDDLTELIVTADMPERKSTMIELGDAFIAFPGGTGTLEEITEVIEKKALIEFEGSGGIEAPCFLYNLNGYYEGLRILLDHMVEEGFTTRERLRGVYFVEDLKEIASLLSKSR